MSINNMACDGYYVRINGTTNHSQFEFSLVAIISFFPHDEQFEFTASSNILNKLYLYSFLLYDFFNAKLLEPIELNIYAPGTSLVAY